MRKKHAYTFEVLARFIHEYLKEEGLSLNFKGFKDTQKAYARLNDNHISEVYDVLNDCHMWSNYLQEVSHFISLKIEDIQLEVDNLSAQHDKKNPRFDLLDELDKAKEKLKHFKLFAKELKSQRQFFVKASESCYRLYKKHAHQQ